MAGAGRGGARAAILLLLASCAAFLVLHGRGIQGEFLSDDFVHAAWIAEAQRGEGGLVGWLWKLLYTPLPSGNYAYRPVAFASYSLDWLWHGMDAGGWRMTSYAIHLANGILVLLLAHRLARQSGIADARFAAIAAMALFVAIPFAGESTYWLVGRFDLLACLFSLAFLQVFLDEAAPAGPWRPWLMAGFLLGALLSKESAMPVLAVCAVLAFAPRFAELRAGSRGWALPARAAARETLVRIWPVIALALAYFAWRAHVFGSPWKVYPDSRFPGSLGEFIGRVAAIRHSAGQPYAGHAGAWIALGTLTLAAWVGGWLASARRTPLRAHGLALGLLACLAMYLLAPATSFSVATPNGEGTRNLYIPWAFFCLLAGITLAHHRARLALLGAMLAMAVWGQWQMLRPWQEAAREMRQIVAAIPALAAGVGDAQYALILLPDHVGPVPFVRNCQGALVTPPRQPAAYLSKAAAFSPLQFPDWERHFEDNTIGTLKGSATAFDRRDFKGVYCWTPALQRFARLDALPVAGDWQAWERNTMAEAVGRGCLR